MEHRILIIDDEVPFCEILSTNLKKDGYKIDYVYSALEALSLDLSVYSLLMVDIRMDGMTGTEFVRTIRKNLDTKLTPVIFCTANHEEESKLLGFDLGADDYITKPFNLDTVRRRVKSVLRRCYPELNEEN